MEHNEWQEIYREYYQPLYMYALALEQSRENERLQTVKDGREYREPLPALLISEQQKKLLSLLQQLPERQKEILIESTYFEINDEELAVRFATSPVNIRKIRQRARQQLTKMWREDEA